MSAKVIVTESPTCRCRALASSAWTATVPRVSSVTEPDFTVKSMLLAGIPGCSVILNQ